MKKPILDNESAISYVWFQSMAISVVAIVAWVVFCHALNLFAVPFDMFIDNGVMSEQTATTAGNALAILGAFPILLIIGLAINSFATAANSRNTGMPAGGMQAFGYGTFVMLSFFILAYILALTGGLIVDELEVNILDPTEPIYPISTEWQEAQEMSAGFINMLMFVPYFIEILGGLIFFQSILQRTSGSQYYSGGY